MQSLYDLKQTKVRNPLPNEIMWSEDTAIAKGVNFDDIVRRMQDRNYITTLSYTHEAIGRVVYLKLRN